MTNHETARNAAEINFEIAVVHGVPECKVGFVWHDTFIHNPFVDPQYGAFEVDPDQQYGDAYRQSIFASDPAKALEMAEKDLRDKTSKDFSRYCMDNKLNATATIESICGARLPEGDHDLGLLTVEQVVRIWAHVDGFNEGAITEPLRGR